jgi:EAL domain-containing protein (putative c-di-GMP-specific phosphodiesterase class I)
MAGPDLYAVPSATEPLDPLQAAIASRDKDVPTMVRSALAAGRAQLAFQPVMRPGGGTTPAFYEGLIRILDDGGRILPARQFMPDVEETDLGRDIDCASLKLGLEKLHANPGLRLAINMSARSIADGRWREILKQGLGGDDLGNRLILEISEQSAMMLPEVVIRFMAEIQPRGVAFALDDFGAGLTAFRYLKDFFFDLAKLDKHFVRDIDTSPDNQVLSEALITVAHQFEMFVVAEGVETTQEAAVLTDLGVDCLQGYLYGVPKAGL